MKPTIVFIPGMMNDERIFKSLINEIDGIDYYVLNVENQKSINEMAADAWKLIAEIPNDIPIVLCGFSMGGYVALNMIANMELPISSALLISTSARADSEEAKESRLKSIHYMENNFSLFVDKLADFGIYDKKNESHQIIVDMALDIGKEVAICQCKAVMDRPDLRDKLGSISIPVHILCGKNDKITPLELSQELHELIADSRLYAIENAGHMLPIEKSKVVAEIIEKKFIL